MKFFHKIPFLKKSQRAAVLDGDNAPLNIERLNIEEKEALSERVFIEGDDESDGIVKKIYSEPKITTFKRTLVIGLMVLALSIAVGVLTYGLFSSPTRTRKSEEVVQSSTTSGKHLEKIPKDYSQNVKRIEESSPKLVVKEPDKTVNVPVKPVAPVIVPPKKEGLSAEEKALLARYEARRKAMESPIKFNVKLD